MNAPEGTIQGCLDEINEVAIQMRRITHGPDGPRLFKPSAIEPYADMLVRRCEKLLALAEFIQDRTTDYGRV